MRDSTGREWRFTYVCWRNGMTVMYVLEGLNGYMLINQWRAGDKGNACMQLSLSLLFLVSFIDLDWCILFQWHFTELFRKESFKSEQ